jgi:hypothetical protein
MMTTFLFSHGQKLRRSILFIVLVALASEMGNPCVWSYCLPWRNIDHSTTAKKRLLRNTADIDRLRDDMLVFGKVGFKNVSKH